MTQWNLNLFFPHLLNSDVASFDMTMIKPTCTWGFYTTTNLFYDYK